MDAQQHHLGPWGWFNRGLGLLQRIVGRLLFVIVLLVVAATVITALIPEDKPSLPDNGVIAWAPSGFLVEEERRFDPEFLVNDVLAGSESEIVLRHALDGLHKVKNDDDVTTLVIDLNGFGGGTPSAVHELADAVQAVKDAGKTVIAHGEYYTQSSYLVASAASEIILHPDSFVEITGYGRFRTYYRELLDTLQIKVNVFRVGTFKSALEPILGNTMSDAAKEANAGYLGVLWNAYTQAVEERRGLPAGALQQIIDGLPARIEANGGDLAQDAVDQGLVDRLAGRAELKDSLVTQFGEDDDQDDGRKRFTALSFNVYRELDPDPEPKGDLVAVVTAAGVIVDGAGDGGVAGGDPHARLIREARLDDDVKAIVLRVDSPGGSAFASEVIREEIVAARADGKPVVVSMGGLAASGGYWISSPADEIWATPTTITGSIGIFAFLPTFESTAAWVGVNEDGVGTTALSNLVSPLSGVSPEAATIIQAAIEHGYEAFLARVGEGRDMSRDQVDAIAQGRVWAGATALELGLVDKLGGLTDAVASAAALAGLDEDAYATKHFVDEVTPWEVIQDNLGLSATDAVSAALPRPVSGTIKAALSDMAWLIAADDPQARYAVCLECLAMARSAY